MTVETSTSSVAAADLLGRAQQLERAGQMAEAIAGFEAAIAEAERQGEGAVLAEALRRLAVLRHHQDETDVARALCDRSYEVACALGDNRLAAETLNTAGGLDLTAGSLEDARGAFLRALKLGWRNRALRARVEQNLGILANIQGELDEALTRYRQSLAAYQAAGDEHGCALVYHNLGMVSADRELFDQADRYFRESLAIAERVGDSYLQGLCLVNHAEVDIARQRFENARQSAEDALGLFQPGGVGGGLGGGGACADAHRMIGVVYRETGRPAVAEVRLRRAMELAAVSGAALSEAEASRELAILYQSLGRNLEALTLLNAAYRLFRRVDARADLVNVAGKVAALEGTYLAVVREWGQSMESTDRYTFGHCERVARHAVAMARVLGLDDQMETTILLGAYLHDVGKVRIPSEILLKPGALSPDEREVVRMHPIWGVELLANVEFPWDIKPIIRWHHERGDGSGYPDRLTRDQIPLPAQIVGILDVYDALTTSRPYQAALPPDEAVTKIARCREWWSERVFDAFLQVIVRGRASSDDPRRPVDGGDEDAVQNTH